MNALAWITHQLRNAASGLRPHSSLCLFAHAASTGSTSTGLVKPQSGASRSALGRTSELVHIAVITWLLSGCGTATTAPDYSWYDGTRAKHAGDAFVVRWTQPLAKPFEGRSIPVERAGAVADTRRHFVYVASTTGTLWSLTAEGDRRYRHEMDAGVESPPVLDEGADRLFAVAATGVVHALRGSTGELLWEAHVGAPVSATMALSDDALYVACDDDSVVALSRADGEVLWRYRREPRTGFKIAGQAGLLLHDGRVVTGFSDGVIASLDAGDGREMWHVDTSLDVLGTGDERTRFIDVDTTPVQIGDDVYAASFSGGLYIVDSKRGIVRKRMSELTGVTGIDGDDRALLLSSADHGVLCLDVASHGLRWRHRIDRGAPGRPTLQAGTVYVAESGGALLALTLSDGRETGRLESGHGFDAGPLLRSGRGFIVSNAGTLFAFSY